MDSSPGSTVAKVITEAVATRLADAVASRLETKLTRMEDQLKTLTGRLEQHRGSDLRMRQEHQPSVRLQEEMSGRERSDSPHLTGLLSPPASEHQGAKRFSRGSRARTLEVYSAIPGESDSEHSVGSAAQTSYLAELDARLLAYLREPEPERVGALAACVTSDAFGIASLLMIFMNTAFTWFTTDYIAYHLLPERQWMQWMELFFLGFYTVELALKLVVHGRWYFYNSDWAWNIFDFLVVAVGIAQWCVEEVAEVRVGDATILRACRLMRLSKMIRVLKSVKYFEEFRLMATCVLKSFIPLFWATTFLGLMLIMAAFLFVDSMANFRMEHPDCDHEHCKAIPDRFGSVASAYVTLLESTTGGCDWDDVYQVVALTGVFNRVLFLAYIIFYNFAFFNIVMSIFVDKVMKLARPSHEALLFERKEEEQAFAEDLRALIRELDIDRNGSISLQELTVETRDEDTRQKLELLGIKVHEMVEFFQTLCRFKHCEELSIDDLVCACLKMRGPASSMDLHAIVFRLEALALSSEAASLTEEAGRVEPLARRRFSFGQSW